MPTSGEREQQIAQLVATYEMTAGALYHGSGEARFPEGEMARQLAEARAVFDSQIEVIGSAAQAEMRGAEEALEAMGQTRALDPVYSLGAADLQRASALRAFVAEEAGQPLFAVEQTIRGLIRGDDRAAKAVWLRELSRRLDATEPQAERDRIRSWVDALGATFAPDPSSLAEERRKADSVRVFSRDLLGTVRRATDRVHAAERAALEAQKRAASAISL